MNCHDLKVFKRTFTATMLALLLVFGLLPRCAYGDPIYTWKDENGRVVFGTKPPSDAATEANLPEINREDLELKIEKLKKNLPPNCIKHGGVDCSKGADGDGSVICLDGYKNAILPFRFKCRTASLAVSRIEIEVPNAASQSESMNNLQLVLRNLADVAAEDVQVEFIISKRSKIRANGPSRVEPFGIADYILPLTDGAKQLSPLTIGDIEFKARCANCSSTIRKRIKDVKSD